MAVRQLNILRVPTVLCVRYVQKLTPSDNLDDRTLIGVREAFPPPCAQRRLEGVAELKERTPELVRIPWSCTEACK